MEHAGGLLQALAATWPSYLSSLAAFATIGAVVVAPLVAIVFFLAGSIYYAATASGLAVVDDGDEDAAALDV